MKKILFIMLAALLAAPLYSQVTFGIKAGGNGGNFRFSHKTFDFQLLTFD